MIRVAFLLIIAVAAMLASWQLVTTDPGEVQVTWFGYDIATSALFASLILVVIIAISLPLLRMLMFLMDAPGRIGKASQRARVRRGQEALALGLIAAEAGEFEEARKHAGKAEDLIDEPRLAALLQARSAEVSGDYAAAERAYSGMLAQRRYRSAWPQRLDDGGAQARRSHSCDGACRCSVESVKVRVMAVPICFRP